MEAGEAYERRVWRIALLLTDDAPGADSILEGVVRVQPDLAKVGDTRLDRMVVLAARGWRGSGPGLGELLELDEATGELWRAVGDLGEQAREAWVFRELEGMESIRAARAMDCSRTAMEQVHLEAARRVLDARLGEGVGPTTERLAGALAALDESPAMRSALECAAGARRDAMRRRRRVSVLLLVILLVCFGLMIFVLLSLLGWDEKNEMNKMRSDEYSNPRLETWEEMGIDADGQ